MRISYSKMFLKFLRNINSVGSTDTNIQAEFDYQLGIYYQLMLAKLKNYKTYTTTSFLTGMNTTLVSTGTAQSISTITSSATTATVTTSAAHGYSTSNVVTISGVNPSGYNGTFTITVLTTTTFTYTLPVSVSNVAGTSSQYFSYPPGYVTADGIVVTVGAVNFPLKIIDSEYLWEQLNSITIQASTMPQFYFPRRDDFGIWPIPQAAYTGTLYYHYRDRNLSVADYMAGTISVTQGSNIVTGSSTTFTQAMVGRWFVIDDPTVAGQGYWYRISTYTSATSIKLDRTYTGSSASGVTLYRVCETPELPEEGHQCLVDGVTGGFYMDTRKDVTNGQAFLNKFYTGDASNPSRQEGDTKITAGLIGLINRYADRDDTRIITRRPSLNPLQFKPWSMSLTS